jgi:uncharacterized RDD family membrane protein YckC
VTEPADVRYAGFWRRLTAGTIDFVLFLPVTWLLYFYFAWLASEFIVLLLNRRRRALHDFIAGTVVVVARSTAKAPNLAESAATGNF